MNDYQSFWQGKKCVVTGGIGFIGSHMSAALHDCGARVTVLDKELPHDRTLFHHLNHDRNIQFMQCDVADQQAVQTIMDIQPCFVFHLAGLPYAPYTTSHPFEAHRANVDTTVQMLAAARMVGDVGFVHASSACVFGAAQHSPSMWTTSYIHPSTTIQLPSVRQKIRFMPLEIAMVFMQLSAVWAMSTDLGIGTLEESCRKYAGS